MARRDRRRAKRFLLEFPTCRTTPEMQGFCVVRDLSLHGAQVLHREPPPLGMTIELWFDRGPLLGMRAAGRVIRHNLRGEAGFGVEFTGPNMRLLLSAVGKNAQVKSRGAKPREPS